MKNREAILKQQHVYLDRIKREWNGGVKTSPEIQRKAEVLASSVLTANGFGLVQRMSYEFPYDYLAKKDGQLYFIEVTTSRLKRMAKKIRSRHPRKRKDFTWRLDFDRVALAEYVGAKVVVVFITPSLEKYHLLLEPKFRPTKTVFYQSAQINGLLSQLR